MPRFAAAAALGLLLGWAAAHVLSLQWWTLVPWGLAAVVLGYRATRAAALVAGALTGSSYASYSPSRPMAGQLRRSLGYRSSRCWVSSVPCAVCCLHYSGRPHAAETRATGITVQG